MAAVFFTSIAVGLILQPILIPWLKRRGVMDVPNERSSHVQATPRGGGGAVVVAFGAGLLVGCVGGLSVPSVVTLVGAVALGAVGLADDIKGLSARLRLGCLLLVGAVAGPLLSAGYPLILSVPLMALWSATYVNAFNFMDGINGISGFTGVVSGVSYALMGVAFGSYAAVVIGVALAGASVSFLPYNFPSASVFLGDAGSYSLGFVAAALGFILWSSGTPLGLALAPSAVYLADTGATLVRRYRRGAPLVEAHRDHTYQRLSARGSHWPVALVLVGIQTLVIAVSWWGVTVQKPLLGAAGVLVILSAYLLSPSLLGPVRART